MTREEAIKIIQNHDSLECGICFQGGDEIEEAFNMAIQALEDQDLHPATPENIKRFICRDGMTDGVTLSRILRGSLRYEQIQTTNEKEQILHS